MHTRLVASSILAALAAASAPALAQQVRTDPPAPATAAGPTAAPGRSAPLTAAAAPPAPDTQDLMAQDGGSLLQASVPATTDDKSTGTTGAAARAPSYSLYAVPDPEPHVLKKHDLVNIVVREQSTSATGGQSNQQRKVDFDAKVDNFIKFNLAALSVHPTGGTNPEIKLEGARDFQGTGEYDRTDSMTTRLEAEVIDVKPNGTLVIQARRRMQVDEETINVTLTGVCRVQDVDATNSILSTDMHDLDLRKATTGQVRDTTRRGLLHRLLDIVNPF